MGRNRRVTLRDIAAETGLSVAAVSYALRGLHVPVDTQKRVRKVAAELGYTVDPIARALASGRSDHVGVVCRSLSDLWQQALVADLGRALLGSGRQALIVDSGEDAELEAKLARRLVDQRVDALVVLPVAPDRGYWADLAEECVLVSVGDDLPGATPHGVVVFDNAAAAEEGLTQLARLGHSRVSVLVPITFTSRERPAATAVRQAAAQVGVQVEFHTCPSDLDGSAATVGELLAAPDRPTAFYCLSDSIAYGVYSAARSAGLDVPSDLSVLGSDDNPVSALLTPPLTTARWPMSQVVDAVVSVVTAGIDAGESRGTTVIAHRWQARGSLGPSPQR